MQKRLYTLFKTLLFTTALSTTLFLSPQVHAQEPFLGEIRAFGFNFAPRGWAKCDGQLLQISQNAALFSLLGTMYGGDGRTTFALPDLRGRVAIHQGRGGGLSNRTMGQKSGQESVTLTTGQMPSHTHTALIQVTSAAGDKTSPTNSVLAYDPREKQYSSVVSNETMNASSVIVQSQGSSQSHENMQPYTVVNYCIATAGIFPSRN